MGYNGGTNKRGYYRRYNGMYSKSSYRSGEKLLSNTILGGLGLLGAGVSALSELADNAPEIPQSDYKHFSPTRHHVKHIIWGLIALLCPIAGFATFTFAEWPIFFSILLFGIIEIIPCAVCCSLETDLTFARYYFQHEVEEIIPQCKRNLKTHIVFLIILLILNLYPLVYAILDLIVGDFFEGMGGFELTAWLFVIKIFLNGYLIYMAFTELKSAEDIIRSHAIKGKATVANNTSNATNHKQPALNEESIEGKNIEEDETINLIVNQRIQDLIQKDHDLETIYFFYKKLMSEESFDKQHFTLKFKQKWFTYEEYKKHWENVHWELSLYTKIHLLAIDITINNAISLEDFKDVSTFETKRNNLLTERINNKEQRVLNRLKLTQKLSRNCSIFDYQHCRSIKLEAQESPKDSLFFLQCEYERCLKDALQIGILFNFYPFYTSFMDVEFGIQIDPLSLNKKNDKEPTQSHYNKQELCSNATNINKDDTYDNIMEEEPESDAQSPSIRGEYVEAFKYPYGKLHIDSSSASIRFYFPGPDARYKGTHFNIWEEDIDKYIKAYQNNWETGIKLREKAKETPKTELKQVGEMSMNIVATAQSFTIYLHHYHLPIYKKKEYEEMVMLLQQAKHKIKEVRKKLFA
jgi:hypothetical protein